MQSYASPGRVITVANIGPGAVAVRADQPYRLGNFVGVTDAPAGVGDDLNLCVEGVFEQMVALADGLAAAEAGTPVLMHVATFALVVGLTDATDHVHFGVLAERMTRRRVVLVKLMPATAAAPATGGGDGGNGDPALLGRVGAAEDAIVALDGRMDAAEAAIAAGEGGTGGATEASALVVSGFSLGPSYSNSTSQYLYATTSLDGVGARPMFVMAQSPDIVFPASRYPAGVPSADYIQVRKRGLYEVTVQLTLSSNINDFGVLVNAYVYDQSGVFIDSMANLTRPHGPVVQDYNQVVTRGSNEVFYHRVGKNSGFLGLRAQRTISLDAGWKIALQIDGTSPSSNTEDGSAIIISNRSDPNDASDPYGWYFGANTGLTMRRIA